MKSKKMTAGFTLVELIVVIAILGILAGVGTVGYSGYIKKANMAADEQLLGFANQAFTTACLENGVDARSLTSASMPLTADKKVDVNNVSPYSAEFAKYFAGNENSAFKVITGVYFVDGLFVQMSGEMVSLQEYLLETFGGDDGAIKAVQDSIYHTIGYGVLAENIDNAANMMAGIVTDNPTSGFTALLTGEANYSTLLSYFDNNEDEIIALGLKKADQLKNDPAYAGKEQEKLEEIALNQLLANTAVLTAAQNSGAVNDAFIASLGNGSAVSALKASTDGGDATSDTVAQAAFAYAMYTSYKASIGETPSGEVNLTDVYDTLETEEFQYYMNNNSAADKDGYLGAMQMIVASANNADSGMINDILLNGFNSSELVGLMQNVTAK